MIEETLNEHQKRRIVERLKLDFNEELLKTKKNINRQRFLLNFRNQIDIFITELYNDGVMFYGFSIIMPFSNKNDPKLWYYTHLRVEDLINYIKEKIELVEFCYLSIELTKNTAEFLVNNTVKDLMSQEANLGIGIPFFKGILGVRSLIGQNKSHFNEIKKILNIQLNHTIIEQLFTIDSIKDYWDFVIKEQNFLFHRFAQYSNYYDSIYGDIADLELQYDEVKRIAFGLDEHVDALYSNLAGIRDINPYSQTIINYLITLYMNQENIFLSKNNFYQINDSKIKRIGALNFIEKNNIKIFNKLITQFPQQLKGIKIPRLFVEGWNKFYEDIKKNNHYLPGMKK